MLFYLFIAETQKQFAISAADSQTCRGDNNHVH